MERNEKRMKKGNSKSKITNTSKYGKVSECQELFRMGRDTVRRIAKEAGAIVRVGRTVNVDIQKMIAYIEENYTGSF